jgi:hypothetical protein
VAGLGCTTLQRPPLPPLRSFAHTQPAFYKSGSQHALAAAAIAIDY